MVVMKVTYDARTFIHCECGAFVYEHPGIEPSEYAVPGRNARCKHRDDRFHYRITPIESIKFLRKEG